MPGSGTPHGDTLKPLRRTCGREVARPEIRPERQNCVPGYTRWEIWGIWSMAADEIRWGIEYQGENQKNNGLARSRLTDSGKVADRDFSAGLPWTLSFVLRTKKSPAMSRTQLQV